MLKINESRDKNSYLSFTLSKEKFATQVDRVLNILEMRIITKVPHSPPYMKGEINFRGKILPIIDLHIKLNIPTKNYRADPSIIIFNTLIKNQSIIIGVLADDINEVCELTEANIKPTTSIRKKYYAEFVHGIYRAKDNNLIMLLDIDKIFANEEKFIIKNEELEIYN